MTVHLPEIGITGCERAKSLIEEFPQNIVGSFWVMCSYGFDFDREEIPDWWINLDSAQDIIDVFEEGYFDGGHNCPVYLGFCIVVIAEPSNPAHLSYVIDISENCQTLTMNTFWKAIANCKYLHILH